MKEFSEKFLLLNQSKVKNLSIILEIDGIGLFSNRAVYTYLRYGDRIFYGEDIYYGGMRRVDGVLDVISYEKSNLVLSQKIEPEQGRGSISSLSIALVDKDQKVSELFAIGKKIDDILGAKVSVWFGYEGGSFREDYVRIFRGIVNNVTYNSGVYVLSFADSNLKSKTSIFNTQKTKLKNSIMATDTTIELVSTAFMYQGVQDAEGFFDCAYPFDKMGVFNPLNSKADGYRLYLKIDDEYILYPPIPITNTTIINNCIRGQRGTAAAAHAAGADVSFAIEIQDNAIDMALKILMSGKGDYYLKDLPIKNLVKTFDVNLGDVNNAIVLGSGFDAVRDYGLSVGDYIRVKGAVNSSNNGVCKILGFLNLFGEKNRVIVTNKVFSTEVNTTAKFDARSKYDIYPKECGIGLTPLEINVNDFEEVRRMYLNLPEHRLRFFVNKNEDGKNFIENEIYLPFALYPVTRRGKISIKQTNVPVFRDEIKIIDKNNIIDIQSAVVNRGLTNRRYFSEVDFNYDTNDKGEFTRYSRFIDTEAIFIFEKNSILPITSRGLRFDLGAEGEIEKRARYLIIRYGKAAITLTLKVNMEAAAVIEVGDVVAVRDEGELQLVDFRSGKRDLGVMLFEVINKSFDIKNAYASLELVSGFASDLNARHGVIAPSSRIIGSGSDSKGDYLIIDSIFQNSVVGGENEKWMNFIGNEVEIWDWDSGLIIHVTKIKSVDLVDKKRIYFDGLPSSLSGNLIIKVSNYGLGQDRTKGAIYKSLFVFLAKQVDVLNGISSSEFVVSNSDLNFLKTGYRVLLHKEDWSSYSKEVIIKEIIGNSVILEEDIGFVPDSTYKVQIMTMPDSSGAYRVFN